MHLAPFWHGPGVTFVDFWKYERRFSFVLVRTFLMFFVSIETRVAQILSPMIFAKRATKNMKIFIPFTESLERPFIWFLSVWKASICISWPRFICWSHWPCERLFDFMGTGKYTRLKKVKEARKLVLLLWKTRENSFLPLWKKSKGTLFVLQLNKYW